MTKLKLRIRWSKREKDFMVYYPRKADGSWILDRITGKKKETCLDSSAKYEPHWTRICGVDWNKAIGLYEVNFIKELEDRGFDKTTLKFEVMIDLRNLASKFSHLLDDLSDREKTQLNNLLEKKQIKLK